MTSIIAGKMAEAAAELVEALDQNQRALACRPFPDDDERRLWFYTPTDHGGLPLAAMSATQHRLVHRLVATGLSREGYVTMAAIMGLENVLDHLEGWKVDFGRERGRDPLLYFITIFGEPGGGATSSEPGGGAAWGWRFGGHHVSLHHTIIEGEVVASTPIFSAPIQRIAHCLGRIYIGHWRPLRIWGGSCFATLSMKREQRR